MMYGCCAGLGDAPLQKSFPWGYLGAVDMDQGYLGQDGSDIVGPTLEEIAGGPIDTVTAGDVANYVATGQADPSVLSQITNIVKAAGGAAQSILQQVQFGQLAANTPINQLPALRAAVTGQTTVGSVLSSVGSNPALLIGGVVLLFLLFQGRGK